MKLLLSSILLSLSALAAPAAAQVLGFAWDNDLVTGTDGQYTNGSRLSWLGDAHPAACESCWAAQSGRLLAGLPGLTSAKEYFFGASLEQLMVTPSDITLATPQYNDTPYAGLLRGELLLIGRRGKGMTGYGLTLGVTGEASRAASSQRRVHRATGSTLPQGWHTQLPQRTVFGVSAGHARELWRGQLGEWDVALTGAAALQADHWLGQASLGFYAGVGRSIPYNFLPMFGATGSAAALSSVPGHQPPGWMLFLGTQSNAVGWSYLERESIRAGYRFRNEDVIGAVNGGVALQFQAWSLVFAFQRPTNYTDLGEAMSFGSITLMRRFQGKAASSQASVLSAR